MDTTERILTKDEKGRISFISFMIPFFADSYKMSIPDAYQFLKKWGGFDFMLEHWWALHTDNVHWAVHDIFQICHKNGGQR